MQYDDGYKEWKNWNDFGDINKKDELFFDMYVKSQLIKSKKNKILEIGFGNGSFLEYGRKIGWEMYGTEVNLNLLESARQNNFTVFEGTNYEELNSNSFDCICAFDVLEHLDKDYLLRLFKNVLKLLKPGGLFIARFPNGDSPFGLYNQNGDLTHISFLGTVAVESLCKDFDKQSLIIKGLKRINDKNIFFHFLYHFSTSSIIKILYIFVSLLFPQFKNEKFFSPNLLMIAKKSKSIEG